MTGETRICRTCGEEKPLDTDYYVTDRVKGHRLRQCRSCHVRQGVERRARRYTPEERREAQRRYNAQRPKEKKRDNYLRSRYGIIGADYDALLNEQGHACAICFRVLADLAEERRVGSRVDHDHGSGQVRGLLCDDCNRGLGAFWDDPERLTRAANYLKSGGVPLAQLHPEWRAKRFLSQGRSR